MAMNDSYLLDAGWLLLAAWTAIVIVFSLIVFGSDLLAAARLEPSRDFSRADSLARRDPIPRA